MSGIYLHIPFCKQACPYFDVYFETRTSELDHFVDRMVEEIQSYGDTKYAEEKVETIYFGGGAPSLLESRQVKQVLSSLHEVFDVDSQETTFEMNPDDTSEAFLSKLYSIGINRISMGVQSFHPELLTLLNRPHTSEESYECLELLVESRFKSFNVDLLYGNPDETMEQLKVDLENLLQFDPPHVSAYTLTIESDTELGKQVEQERITPRDDDKVADQFDMINELLQEHGIQRYEVCNYSRPGSEAIHNSRHWVHKNYLGFGPGAHSFWWDEEAVRWDNEENLQKYLRHQSDIHKEELSYEQLAEERLMMGLRTREGVGIDELTEKYHYSFNSRQREFLKEKQKEGKVVFDDRIALTDSGIRLADAISLDLITLH